MILGFEGDYFFALDDEDIFIQRHENGESGFYQVGIVGDEDEPMTIKVCEVNSHYFVEIPENNDFFSMQSAGSGQLYKLKMNLQNTGFSLKTLIANQQLLDQNNIPYTSVGENHALIFNENLTPAQLLRYLRSGFEMQFDKK